MLERSEDSLLSRVLLLLMLPLAALLGVLSLDDEHDSDHRLSIEEGVGPSDAQAGLEPGADPARPAGLPATRHTLEAAHHFFDATGAGPGVGVRSSFLHRAAYTRLLRHQLLRIPDPDPRGA